MESTSTIFRDLTIRLAHLDPNSVCSYFGLLGLCHLRATRFHTDVADELATLDDTLGATRLRLCPSTIRRPQPKCWAPCELNTTC
jgi:hypothetical protein